MAFARTTGATRAVLSCLASCFALVAAPLLAAPFFTACSVETTPITTGDGGSSNPDGATNPDGGGGGGACKAFCDKAATANCSAKDSCAPDCETQTQKVPANCKDKWTAFLECGAKSTFNGCDDKGKAKLSGCDAELAAFLQCGMGTNPEAGSCGNLQSGKAQCDSCLKQSCCSQSAACYNNDECLKQVNCVSQCNANDQTCVSDCEGKSPSGTTDARAFLSCMNASCAQQCN